MKLQAAISLDLIRNPILSFFIQLTHADMDVIFPIYQIKFALYLVNWMYANMTQNLN